MPGAEQYAKGWIECFHAYQCLGPPETHWSLEHFQKYSEDDLDAGRLRGRPRRHGDLPVDVPRQWYKEGFNTIEQNAQMLERYPGKLTLNGRFDPREGEPGLEQLRADDEPLRAPRASSSTPPSGTAARAAGSSSDPEAIPFFELCQELGIRNIHVHKGPTIWPLDKDAFDVADVDHVATSFPGLNFIVEHVGLPRIEDFCFMATQEPNVYAGLSVVVGGLMHARPRFFAKVMGELLFWVGEDKMLFGSDYGIWEPKWQVEGFVDWDYPDDTFSDYPRLTTTAKKKILGLNAAKLYGIEVPEEFRLPDEAGEPAARDDAQLVEGAAR